MEESSHGSSSRSEISEMSTVSTIMVSAEDTALSIRKKYELKVIKKFDRSRINTSKECWFLMDSCWLNKWSAFVSNPDEDESPGVISSADLLVNGQPRPGLKPKIDYRGVPPLVYYIFVELYGKDSSPEICRYVIDIYKLPVPIERLVDITLRAQLQASVQVNKIRPKWVKWEREEDDKEEEDNSICCGLTKEHLEAFIYWAISCWNARMRSGRDTISYRKYKPLRNNQFEMDDDSLHAKKMRGDSTHSSIRGSIHGKSNPFSSYNSSDDDSSDDEIIMTDAPADIGYTTGSSWFKSR
eukprot:gene8633-11668_t